MDKYIFCKKYNLTLEQFTGEEWIDACLEIYEHELPQGFNPKMTGDLTLRNVKVIPVWFNPVVCGDLRLPSVVSFKPTFDPIVTNTLAFDSLKTIPNGWKPTVGSLHLDGFTTLPNWFEPTAWIVWFNNGKHYSDNFRPANEFYSWRNGQYIKVDGVTTEVIEKRDKVYHVRWMGYDETFYIVTNGKGTYSHGDTLAKAKTNLKLKLTMKWISGKREY